MPTRTIGIWSLDLRTWNLKLGTWNLELGTWNLELGTYKLEIDETLFVKCGARSMNMTMEKRERHIADSLIALSSIISKSKPRSSSIFATTTLCLVGPLPLRVFPCSEPSPASSTPSRVPVANSDDEPCGEGLENAEIWPPASRPTPGADLDAASRAGKSPRV
jgi:hypothetical protein